MPKKKVAGGVAGGVVGVAALPTWQATGLSLAVLVGDVFNGSGVLAFGLLSLGVIWVLHRLHARTPGARSTGELIGSVLGAPHGHAVGVLQFVAYVLLGAYAATSAGLLALAVTADPTAASAEWWWPASAVIAVALASVLVGALPTRTLATVVTVLAAFALLTYFYVALAVLAKVASGTAPVEIAATSTSSGLVPAAVVIALAIGVAGFEIPTAAGNRLSSVGRPLGWAMALAVVCAATAWVATNVGAAGEFRYDAIDLAMIAADMFSEGVSLWLLAASVAAASTGLIVLMWGATRVARPPIDGVMGMVVTAVAIALLAVAMCRGWGDASAKLWGVAGILLMIVYVLAAQANSRVDDANTVAFWIFVVMGAALIAAVGVVLFGRDGNLGLWSVGITAVIVGLAVAPAAGRTGLRRRPPR